jgi:hypothetical protein
LRGLDEFDVVTTTQAANQKYRPHAKRWKRYEKPQPGYRICLGDIGLRSPQEIGQRRPFCPTRVDVVDVTVIYVAQAAADGARTSGQKKDNRDMSP